MKKRFKNGELVIKKDGGNKMRILDYRNGMYTCLWATETMNCQDFLEDDLLNINEYESWLKKKTRQEKLNEILKG